jgi:hypothetical protein
MAGGGSPENSAASEGFKVRKEVVEARELSKDPFVAEEGSGAAPVSSDGGVGRCGFKSGELGGNARRLVPREDVLACEERLGVVGRLKKLVERRARRGVAMAAVANWRVHGSELGHVR